jgi:uncharacterized protein (TIGR03083 family)
MSDAAIGTTDDVWTRLRRQRRAAADYFDSVTPDEWQRPSLCAGWTNRDVLAHLTAGSRSTLGGFIGGMLKARFDFHRFIADRLAAEAGKQPPELLADFRRLLDAKTHPGKAMFARRSCTPRTCAGRRAAAPSTTTPATCVSSPSTTSAAAGRSV